MGLSPGASRVRELVEQAFGKQVIKLIRRHGLGMDRKFCEFIPEDQINLANRKPDPSQDYWYYQGPSDSKNRPFCHDMLLFDKVFSSSDIGFLSTNLGYDVLKYKGGYNCRHGWIRFRGKVIYTPPPTPNQMRVLTAPGMPYKDPFSK